jgi:hypothetical protein
MIVKESYIRAPDFVRMYPERLKLFLFSCIKHVESIHVIEIGSKILGSKRHKTNGKDERKGQDLFHDDGFTARYILA